MLGICSSGGVFSASANAAAPVDPALAAPVGTALAIPAAACVLTAPATVATALLLAEIVAVALFALLFAEVAAVTATALLAIAASLALLVLLVPVGIFFALVLVTDALFALVGVRGRGLGMYLTETITAERKRIRKTRFMKSSCVNTARDRSRSRKSPFPQ